MDLPRSRQIEGRRTLPNRVITQYGNHWFDTCTTLAEFHWLPNLEALIADSANFDSSGIFADSDRYQWL